MKIVFLGTPDFAVASLDALVKANYDVVGVITAPDKKAGRGMKLQESAVKKYAVSAGLNVLQPANLKDETFLSELKSLNADLQVIVAFRMLPEAVWNMPKFGTFNLHASLLPDYRGAAPINWAVINGEHETGVTTFFLDDKIDTGEIIDNRKVSIAPNESAGVLHDRLMDIGSELVVETVKKVESGDLVTQNQDKILDGRAPKLAYKIFKDTCLIDWNATQHDVFNKIRGLSPYPAAFTNLVFPDGKMLGLKIYAAEKSNEVVPAGKLVNADKSTLLIGCADGALKITELQLAGKKRMSTQSFLQGASVEGVTIA